MRFTPLILGLPVVSASFRPFELTRRSTLMGGVPGFHKRNMGDGTEDPSNSGVCNSDARQWPKCKTDADCKDPTGVHPNNLFGYIPTFSEVVDFKIKYGEGVCYDYADGVSSCRAILQTDEEATEYCTDLTKLFHDVNDGITLVAACIDHSSGSLYCDNLCDPTVNASCSTTSYHQIAGCEDLYIGVGSNGPKNWGCGVPLPPGAHYAGEGQKGDPGSLVPPGPGPSPSPGPPPPSSSPSPSPGSVPPSGEKHHKKKHHKHSKKQHSSGHHPH